MREEINGKKDGGKKNSRTLRLSILVPLLFFFPAFFFPNPGLANSPAELYYEQGERHGSE